MEAICLAQENPCRRGIDGRPRRTQRGHSLRLAVVGTMACWNSRAGDSLNCRLPARLRQTNAPLPELIARRGLPHKRGVEN